MNGGTHRKGKQFCLTHTRKISYNALTEKFIDLVLCTRAFAMDSCDLRIVA